MYNNNFKSIVLLTIFFFKLLDEILKTLFIIIIIHSLQYTIMLLAKKYNPNLSHSLNHRTCNYTKKLINI